MLVRGRELIHPDIELSVRLDLVDASWRFDLDLRFWWSLSRDRCGLIFAADWCRDRCRDPATFSQRTGFVIVGGEQADNRLNIN
jgi:hypothetical protein